MGWRPTWAGRCAPSSTPGRWPPRQPAPLAKSWTPRWSPASTADLDTSRAVAAAQTYLAASDVTGSVSISNGTTVVVTTSARYPTKVLGIIGIDTLTVTGRGEARTVRALDGGER